MERTNGQANGTSKRATEKKKQKQATQIDDPDTTTSRTTYVYACMSVYDYVCMRKPEKAKQSQH